MMQLSAITPRASVLPVSGGLGAHGPREVLSDKRIFIVEDDVFIAMDLSCTIDEASAIPIGPVGHLSSGVELARTEEIDAAILDVDIDGEDVFPIAEILSTRRIPFLFYTGHGVRLELQERYANAPVLFKPATTEDLLDTVEALLQSALG